MEKASEKAPQQIVDDSEKTVAEKALARFVAETAPEKISLVRDKEPNARLAAEAAEAARPSVLKSGIDKITSTVITNDETRASVNHYGAEFLKTASLFSAGKVGLASTILAYGLDQAKAGDDLTVQVQDFALGGMKGGALKAMFGVIGASGHYAPVKGAMMGVGAGSAEVLFNRETFKNPSTFSERLREQALNPQALLLNAAVFTAGQGLYSGLNLASKGSLANNRLLSGMVTGGSFGFVNGTVAEGTRQLAEDGKIDITKMLLKGSLEAGVGAAGAGFGIKVSDPAFHARIKNSASSTLESLGLNPSPSAREYLVTGGKNELSRFAEEKTSTALTTVREVRNILGFERIGQEKQMLLQHSEQTRGRIPIPALADILASCNPEKLTPAERASHLFSKGKGPVFLEQGKNDRIRLTVGENATQWKNSIGGNRVMLGQHETPINVMAPLLVGDPHAINSPSSNQAWEQFNSQLAQAKRIGVTGVSTDVWWGVIEPKQGQFDFRYYDKLSNSITGNGLKWMPILSLHQAGGNVGDTVSVPVPFWVWNKISSQIPGSSPDVGKFKSEYGNVSSEYVNFAADKYAMPMYRSVMEAFQKQYASKASQISEVNVSMGPAGEARYPSYNQHDGKLAEYPGRGALQAHSDLQKADFHDFVMRKYGSFEAVEKAWGGKVHKIEPPVNGDAFFRDKIHTNTQYGKDFFDWYNGALINHVQGVLKTSFDVFSNKQAPFRDIDIGAKIPGIHWRTGVNDGGKITIGDRLAELNAGLIRTSSNDWHSDELGRGYRPLLSGIKDASTQPGAGRFTLHFTCLEMLDGWDGPKANALPHSLARWVGREAAHQGLRLKGENALNFTLGDWKSWESMRGHLNYPGHKGYYDGLTLLRMGDVIHTPSEAHLKGLIDTIRSTTTSGGATGTMVEPLKPAG